MLVELDLVEQRYQAVLEVLGDGASVTDVARRYGVARQTVHDWLRKYTAVGLRGLADRSSRPLSCPHQMPPGVEARIVEMRRAHPGWGRARSCFGSTGRGWRRCRGARRWSAAWSATGWLPGRPASASARTTSAGSGPGRWSCGRWTS